MPYETRKDGEDYTVINTETNEVKAKHLPPDAKEKADAQVKLLRDLEEGMSNGTE
jgi:hypothetical protein